MAFWLFNCKTRDTSNAILEAVELTLVEANADLDAFSMDVSVELTQADDVDTNVVIVGAGIAGLMAAYELRDDYPEVNFIVVEKLSTIGGSISTTGGAIYGMTSNIHEENEVEPSTVEDIIDLFEYTSSAETYDALVESVFSNSEDTINRLEAYGGPYTGNVEFSSPYSSALYALRFDGNGSGFQTFLEEMVEENEFDLRLNTTVTELVVVDGVVSGVVVEDQTATYTINADSVILATGGFGSNEEMMEEYAPEYADGVIATNGGAKGDGITLTEQFNTELVGYGTMGSIVASDKSALITSTFMVNLEGQRFVSETSPLYVRQRAVVEQTDSTAFVIADSSAEDLSAYETAVDNGTAYKFDTIEELVAALNIDVDNLVAELEAYNTAVENGETPGYDLAAESALTITTAPYYVQETIIRTFGTITSITINEQAQVLDGDGNPIEGLLACGELTVGNVFTKQYPGIGIGISYASNSGVLAAQTAASSIE